MFGAVDSIGISNTHGSTCVSNTHGSTGVPDTHGSDVLSSEARDGGTAGVVRVDEELA